MANLEKHVKALVHQVAEAESSLVPTRARSAHLVDRYIKIPRRKRVGGGRGSPSSPVLLRMDGVAGTPDARARLQKRVEELNAELREANVPCRLRVV